MGGGNSFSDPFHSKISFTHSQPATGLLFRSYSYSYSSYLPAYCLNPPLNRNPNVTLVQNQLQLAGNVLLSSETACDNSSPSSLLLYILYLAQSQQVQSKV